MQKQLARRIAGEIVISEKPGDTLRKWREIFRLSQKEFANLLEVKPSVVCDFEKGRRASPGIGTVRKFVETMVDYDSAHGGKIVNSMSDRKRKVMIFYVSHEDTQSAMERLLDHSGKINKVEDR